MADLYPMNQKSTHKEQNKTCKPTQKFYILLPCPAEQYLLCEEKQKNHSARKQPVPGLSIRAFNRHFIAYVRKIVRQACRPICETSQNEYTEKGNRFYTYFIYFFINSAHPYISPQFFFQRNCTIPFFFMQPLTAPAGAYSYIIFF